MPEEERGEEGPLGKGSELRIVTYRSFIPPPKKNRSIDWLFRLPPPHLSFSGLKAFKETQVTFRFCYCFLTETCLPSGTTGLGKSIAISH